MNQYDEIQNKSKQIAIIGIECIFPKSNDLKQYWRLLFHGEDAITSVPETHWSLEDYFDDNLKKPDRTYCKKGGFISPVSFDASEFGIPPSSLEATDTSQLLSLLVAKKILINSGYLENTEVDHDRTSVILGVTGTQELVIPLGARLGFPKWRKALESAGVSSETTDEVIERISDSYVSWQENSFPGLLGNVVAGRICNRLNLGGTNCVVDSACASSMSAIHLAMLELLSGRSDMVVTGGVDTLNDIFMHMCFSSTHILSPTNDVRPFSKNADGTVLGEGIGMLLLKRLEDAERDGDNIYAVIKGIGTSSDGKAQSIYAPSPKGQAKALIKAYEYAGVQPGTVKMIEAHGTGTKVGDAVEFQALKDVFQNFKSDNSKEIRKCAIGSVKSMIGHTKAAAGAAGLIKGVLSLHNKVLPPTIKADEPDPNLGLKESPFCLNTELKPWFSDKSHPRRCGVSSFGFGGSNFHIVLEEYQKEKHGVSWDGSVEIIAMSSSSMDTLKDMLADWKKSAEKGMTDEEIAIKASKTRSLFSTDDLFKLLLVVELSRNPSQDIIKTVSRAIKSLSQNKGKGVWTEQNIYFGKKKDPGELAFLFPGQGSQYVNMARDLVCCFPEAMNIIELIDQKFAGRKKISDYIYPEPVKDKKEKLLQESALRSTDIAQPAIGAVSASMLKILHGFGVSPNATGGHSYGEISALFAANWIDMDAFFHLSVSRGKFMAAAGKTGKDSGSMLAVKAPLEEIDKMINETQASFILANRNSPKQGVLSGTSGEIDIAEKLCKERGFRTIKLQVAAAFHSSLVEDAQIPFQNILNGVHIHTSDIPVFSNTTGSAYPHENGEVKKLLGQQILCPVNFVDEIKNLYKTGVRTFLEIGPKGVLTGLVKPILKGNDFHAISMDSSSGKKFGMADLARTLCYLASLGHSVSLTPWEQPPPSPEKKKHRMEIPISGANYRDKKKAKLQPNPRGLKRKPPENNAKPVEKSPDLKAKNQFLTNNDKRQSQYSKTMDFKNKNSKKKYHSRSASDDISNALKIVQEGLKSIQALQIQTTETHKLFLETQRESGRHLKEMMSNMQNLTKSSFGLDFHSENSYPKPLPIPEIMESDEEKGDLTDSNISGSGHAGQKIDGISVLLTTDSITDTNDKGLSINDEISQEKKPSFENKDNSIDGFNEDDIQKKLLSVVSQLTGYPVEMLGLDMDIESDLGIDSIKRVEILSTLEEMMPHLPSVSPESLGNLKTLGHIIDYLSNTKPGANSALNLTDSEKNPITPLEKPKSIASPLKNSKDQGIFRQVIALERKSIPYKKTFLPDDGKVYVIEESTGLSKAIVKEFKSQSIDALCVSPDFIYENKNLPKCSGLILLKDKNYPTSDKDLKKAFQTARYFSTDINKSATKSGAFFATISHIDGAFGFKEKDISNPMQGGLAGLSKTAALEWENANCRAIDISPDWNDHKRIARMITLDLLNCHPQCPVEIGIDPELPDGMRNILTLEASSLPSHSELSVNINPGDVFIVTGGAKGITTETLKSILRYSNPTLVILGRSAPPFSEPKWISSAKDEAAMKKVILENEFKTERVSPKEVQKAYLKYSANREITKNLNLLRSAGSHVLYQTCDVRDLKSIKEIVNSVRKKFGPIRGIIHAAGTIEDKYISDKTNEQFNRVFDTKVQGLKSLLAVTDKDVLNYLILFSSVSGRLGNKGQADYAMANEVLNKTALYESVKQPNCKILSINWGPWDMGMVNPVLQLEFKRNNIQLISPEIGSNLMINEMAMQKNDTVEVVFASLNPSLSSKKKAYKPDYTLAFKREIDLISHPILESHILDGKPVVPFALMTEWLGHSALHENPGLFLYGIDDMRLLKGIRIEQDKKLIRLLAGRPRKKGVLFEVDLEIRDGIKEGKEIIHTKAKAILSDKLAKPPYFDISKHIGTNNYSRSVEEIYNKILFHGIKLHGIKEIVTLTPKIMVAKTRSAPPPDNWVTKPFRSRWIGDPLVLDSAFQMAILWCYEEMGMVSLPSYSASYRQYRSQFPDNGMTVFLEIKTANQHKMHGNFTFLDANHAVVAKLKGYEATMSESLFRAFKSKNAA